MTMKRVFLLALIIGLILTAAEPRFTESNQLRRPEGYRNWPLVGSSLAMSYNEAPSQREEFHHVYLDPKAYKQYKSSGTFPDQTILVMEVYSAASQVSINRQGRFAEKLLRVEAAVKDQRFADKWAYFHFDEGAATAKAFPKKDCWNCHAEHAETDNVFTQFYGVLRAD